MISIIVAKGKNNIIGAGNQMPWHLPADLKKFKELTMGHHIIMGRKTFESIGKALQCRTSVVITRNSDFIANDCIVTDSLEKALKYAEGDNNIFVIGGGEIFKQAMNLCDRIYCTEINADFDGDVLFPEISSSQWKKVSEEVHPADEKNKFSFRFVVYQRY